MSAADFRTRFLELAITAQALRFGEFTLKSGRRSPYFFNAGAFNDGKSLWALSGFFADALQASGLAVDMVFGPAYKGIPLAAGLVAALAARGVNLPFAFNRKEAKDHGEGGVLIGAPLQGRVLIIDDVISAGTSVRESVALIRAAGAEPAGILIALDRREVGQDTSQRRSAAQEVTQQQGLPVIAIANLDTLTGYMENNPELAAFRERLALYRSQYGSDPA